MKVNRKYYQCPLAELITSRPYQLLQTASIYEGDLWGDAEEFDGLR